MEGFNEESQVNSDSVCPLRTCDEFIKILENFQGNEFQLMLEVRQEELAELIPVTRTQMIRYRSALETGFAKLQKEKAIAKQLQKLTESVQKLESQLDYAGQDMKTSKASLFQPRQYSPGIDVHCQSLSSGSEMEQSNEIDQSMDSSEKDVASLQGKCKIFRPTAIVKPLQRTAQPDTQSNSVLEHADGDSGYATGHNNVVSSRFAEYDNFL